MPAERRTPESPYNALVEALLSGQRRTVMHLDRLATRVEDLTGEMIKFSRNQIQMRGDIAELRADIDARFAAQDRRFEAIERRFDAVLARLDELDATVDKNAEDIRQMRIEIVSQYNDILNALHSGQRAELDIEDINARLDDLERRAGMRE